MLALAAEVLDPESFEPLVVGLPGRQVRRSGRREIRAVELEEDPLLAPEVAEGDVAPVVLGSLNSGAGWPTSTAAAGLGPTTTEHTTKAVPTRIVPSARLLRIIWLTPFCINALCGHARPSCPGGVPHILVQVATVRKVKPARCSYSGGRFAEVLGDRPRARIVIEPETRR